MDLLKIALLLITIVTFSFALPTTSVKPAARAYFSLIISDCNSGYVRDRSGRCRPLIED